MADLPGFFLRGQLLTADALNSFLTLFTNATTAASDALTYADNALSSQTAAAASEAGALSSKNAAAASKDAAATSETNAATSATNALASKNAAATSETNAASSASAALTSKNAAATSATDAAASAATAVAAAEEATAGQVPADWDATTGPARILNKPTTFTPSTHSHGVADLSNASANAKSFLQEANYPAMRTALGVAIGSNVQAYHANLDGWAGIAPSAKQNALGYTPANKAGDTFTGTVNGPAFSSTVQSNFQGNQQGSIAQASTPGFGTGGLMVQGDGTGAAYMSFHRPGAYAAVIGLDTDNKWKVGAWSMGTNAYELYHAGNPPPQTYVGGRVTGSTGAILVSSGIVSVTRVSAGVYTGVRSSGLNTNYLVRGTARQATPGAVTVVVEAAAADFTKTATSFQLRCYNLGGALTDPAELSFDILGG